MPSTVTPGEHPIRHNHARCSACGSLGLAGGSVDCPGCGGRMISACPTCEQPIGPSVTWNCTGCGASLVQDHEADPGLSSDHLSV